MAQRACNNTTTLTLPRQRHQCTLDAQRLHSHRFQRARCRLRVMHLTLVRIWPCSAKIPSSLQRTDIVSLQILMLLFTATKLVPAPFAASRTP